MDTVTVPQPPAVSTQNVVPPPPPPTPDSITVDESVTFDLRSDLQLTLQLLKNEYNEDFDENCKTQKLTAKQKALLPLITQVSTAFILEDQFEEIKWVAAGIAKALKAEKVYWDI